MAGHMGNHRVTTQNVLLVGKDDEKNLLYIRGSVPGGENGLVIIRKAGKQRSGAPH
jgi:large subunit ribosomal protein L3